MSESSDRPRMAADETTAEAEALEERRFRALVENAPEGMILVGSDARVQYVNPAVERMFLRTKEHLIDSKGSEWIDPRDQDRILGMFADLVRSPGAVANAELRALGQDGDLRWIECTGTNLLDEADVQAVLVLVRDVTERRAADLKLERAAAELRNSEDRYRQLFDQNPMPSWVYDPETLRFLSVNEAAVARYGYSREEFLAMTIADIRPPEDVPRLLSSARTEARWRHARKDGSIIDVDVQAHDVPFDGQPARLVMAIDVSEERRIEEELRRALETERAAGERLRALDEMKNAFLNAVSHELRTPLSSVLGSSLTLQRLERQLSQNDRRELLEAVVSNAKRLERLLADLLDIDRLSRGVVRPHLAPQDIGRLVRRVVDEREFGLHRQVFVDTRAMVFAVDAPKVERIIENLLVNALKYSPDGTAIHVGVRRIPEGALITVDDEGPGVPESFRQAIFEPFQQGSNVSTHAPGVGIGLSLVAKFAELHGGRAWVEERPGGGSSFRVVIREPTAPIAA